MPSNRFSNGARQKKSTKLSHFLDFRTQPNPTQTPKLDFEISIFGFSKVIFGRVATRVFGFFRKSAFFGGRCAKTKKSIWASHPSFSSPQMGLENGTKTSLAPSGKFRAFGPAKRTFQKNFKKSKKRTFSKKVGSQSGNPFLPKNSRFSAPFGPEKVQLSKKNFRPDFSTNHQVCSVEFGNPKSVKKWLNLVDFFSRAPFEKRLEGKNSPDFYVATASIFGPLRFNLGELGHFENFCPKIRSFGPVLETFRWRPPMCLGRFLAPKILYQMRPIRALKSISTASYGPFFGFWR